MADKLLTFDDGSHYCDVPGVQGALDGVRAWTCPVCNQAWTCKGAYDAGMGCTGATWDKVPK